LQLEAQAAMARAGAARTQRLLDAGFGAKAANDDAQAQREAAEAAAASARARLDDYRIKAPFAGRVLRRDAEPGDLASVGQPMFAIADLHALRITADVDERDVARLAVGMPALIRADGFPGRNFEARISEITPQGDAAGRVFRVRLSLPRDTPLKPGMTVESNMITARRAAAVLAPSSAVSNGAVWVVRNGRAHRQVVSVGVAGAERTEITGLPAGVKVIAKPPTKLKDGQRVAVSSP
jgi:RND family efflux transporter MFP subunit